jgi:hypothetical protein
MRKSYGILSMPLTATPCMIIVRCMNGPLAICGICREIIG